jgi:hypothetical protein
VSNEEAPQEGQQETVGEGQEGQTQEGQAPATQDASIASGQTPSAAAASTEDNKPDEGKAYWPDDWRDKVADMASAGNEKEKGAVMNALARIDNPSSMYSQYRELQKSMGAGNTLKIPDSAIPEEVAQYYKAIDAPLDVEGYYPHIQLQNGATIGDADKPDLDEFITAMHGAVKPQEFVNQATNWYYANRAAKAAEQEQADHNYRSQAMQEMGEHFGDSFERETNGISSLFVDTPGGADLSNPDSLITQMLGSRMPDGSILGNNPAAVKALAVWSKQINPVATVTGDIMGTSKAVETELKEIDTFRRKDKQAYYKDEGMQARERELMAAQDLDLARKQRNENPGEQRAR